MNDTPKTSRWSAFTGWLGRVWKPMRWARNVILICLYMLDATNVYRFIYTGMSAQTRAEYAQYFGITFPITTAVVDATAYAGFITLTLYFMSNTLAHRLADRHPSWNYWVALGIGTAISAICNAGSLFLDTADISITALLQGWGGLLMAALGAVITFGLLFYVVMDAWDLKVKKDEARRAEGMRAWKAPYASS